MQSSITGPSIEDGLPKELVDPAFIGPTTKATKQLRQHQRKKELNVWKHFGAYCPDRQLKSSEALILILGVVYLLFEFVFPWITWRTRRSWITRLVNGHREERLEGAVLDCLKLFCGLYGRTDGVGDGVVGYGHRLRRWFRGEHGGVSTFAITSSAGYGEPYRPPVHPAGRFLLSARDVSVSVMKSTECATPRVRVTRSASSDIPFPCVFRMTSPVATTKIGYAPAAVTGCTGFWCGGGDDVLCQAGSVRRVNATDFEAISSGTFLAVLLELAHTVSDIGNLNCPTPEEK